MPRIGGAIQAAIFLVGSPVHQSSDEREVFVVGSHSPGDPSIRVGNYVSRGLLDTC
ncbi:MAG: hypothetical protein CM1200mP27_05790 [Chloroflexota bacterium]|nr:MAG: hypothetical protein CM1200mP27_05790 [Chloroflexota bacterium]